MSDVYVHLNVSPRLSPVKEMGKLMRSSREGWISAALKYNSVEYTYYDKTPKERKWLNSIERLLKKTCPDDLKTGVHLLGRRCGFMGEDVYLYEGNVTHTIHCFHRKCKTYAVLNWDRLYCATCREPIDREDVLRWDEETKAEV
jgi:hypothetical protein